MQNLVAVVLLLAGCAPCLATLALDLDSSGEARPVSKVVNLLKGMQEQLEAEAKEDGCMSDKMESWCTANEKDNKKIIAESTDTITTQTAAVEENTALVEKLRLEIRSLTQDVAEDRNTLETALAIRKKQRAKFAEREAGLTEKIDSVGKAELAIGSPKAAATGLVQVSHLDIRKTMDQLTKVYNDNYEHIREWTTRGDRMELEDLMQDPTRFVRGLSSSAGFLQAPSTTADTVDGLLRSMREDFEKDLQSEQDQDLSSEKSYQDLKAAKTKEIAMAIEMNETKSEQKADAAENIVKGKADIKAATASKKDAEKYLETVLAKCAEFRAEYQERSSTRTEEMEAVDKAMEVLDGEEAHAVFKRSLSLLQTESSDNRAARASQALASAGRQLGVQALTTLGLEVSYGQFDKVREAMEKMEKSLKKENLDEIKQNDQCIDDFNENQLSDEEKTRVASQLDDKMSTLQEDMATTTREMGDLQGEVNELEKQKQAATENRNKEHKEFMAVIEDQKATRKLLKKAIHVLEKVYAEQGDEEASLAQVQEHSEVIQPPAGFSGYKKSGGGSGVLVLLGQIVEDSQRMEEEAKKADADSGASYAKLKEDTETEIDSKSKEIANKAATKSSLRSDLAEATKSRRVTGDELSSLAKVELALHEECDFLIKNFDLRMKARKQELQALAEAKTILS